MKIRRPKIFATNIYTLKKYFAHNQCIQFAQYSEQRKGRGMEEK